MGSDKSYTLVMKKLREENDICQKELAAYLGIDQRVYSRYETGQNAVPVEIITLLCDYYQVSADYFLGRKEKSSEIKK